jgi:hypothetical protein
MPSLSHPKRCHQAHVLRLEGNCSSAASTIPLWWHRWSRPSTFNAFWVIIIDSSYLTPRLWIAGVLVVAVHFCSKRESKKKRKICNQTTFFIFKLLSLLTFCYIFDHSSYSTNFLKNIICSIVICFIHKRNLNIINLSFYIFKLIC